MQALYTANRDSPIPRSWTITNKLENLGIISIGKPIIRRSYPVIMQAHKILERHEFRPSALIDRESKIINN